MYLHLYYHSLLLYGTAALHVNTYLVVGVRQEQILKHDIVFEDPLLSNAN